MNPKRVESTDLPSRFRRVRGFDTALYHPQTPPEVGVGLVHSLPGELARHMPGMCRHMPGMCPANARHMPGICPAYAWHMPGICPAFARHMPGICRASHINISSNHLCCGRAGLKNCIDIALRVVGTWIASTSHRPKGHAHRHRIELVISGPCGLVD